MNGNVEVYLQLLNLAANVGADLVATIKRHAKTNLTDTDFATLETNWGSLADRTARNAGTAEDETVG